MVQSWRRHAFCGEADDLVLGGRRVSPSAGDQIVETLASGNVDLYTVSPPPGKREYDPINTKRLSRS